MKNKFPSYMLNSNVQTTANPYLDKLSLRNKNLGKKMANNCDLGFNVMAEK